MIIIEFSRPLPLYLYENSILLIVEGQFAVYCDSLSQFLGPIQYTPRKSEERLHPVTERY